MTRLPGALQGARIVGERFVRSRRQQNPDGRMPLIDHIRELRNRVVKMALGLIAGMIAGFAFFTPVWNVIQRPLCSTAIRGHSAVTPSASTSSSLTARWIRSTCGSRSPSSSE